MATLNNSLGFRLYAKRIWYEVLTVFELSVDQLKSIWAANQFAILDNQWIFFGLRGCLPASDASQSFADKHVLEIGRAHV